MLANSRYPDQTPRSVASDLVCTVCIRPTKMTPGQYGLNNCMSQAIVSASFSAVCESINSLLPPLTKSLVSSLM